MVKVSEYTELVIEHKITHNLKQKGEEKGSVATIAINMNTLKKKYSGKNYHSMLVFFQPLYQAKAL